MTFVPALTLSLALCAAAAPLQDAPPAIPPVPKLRPTTAPAEGLPEAKKILEQAVKAMGGRAAIDKIKSGHTVGAVDSPMGKMEIDTYWFEPDRILINQVMVGMGEMNSGFDGEIGWSTNRMTGQYELIDAKQIDEMRAQVLIHRTLSNLEKEFKQIKTVDLTDFDGRPCYKLHVIEKAETSPESEDEQTFMYIDSKTKLFAGMDNQAETQMGPMKITIKFRDWKAIEGVKFYHKMVLSQMGMDLEINYTAIELNKVEASMFEAPAEVKELAKKSKATSRPTSQPVDTGNGDD